jgi:hypothetical protein
LHYTDKGNFSIGYLEPADVSRQSFFGLLKTEGKYSEEVIGQIKKMAPHVKSHIQFFFGPYSY